jgi:hypothetical protein
VRLREPHAVDGEELDVATPGGWIQQEARKVAFGASGSGAATITVTASPSKPGAPPGGRKSAQPLLPLRQAWRRQPSGARKVSCPSPRETVDPGRTCVRDCECHR